MKKKLLFTIIILSLLTMCYVGRTIAARFSVNTHRTDPYRNYKFRVRMEGETVLGINKISALKKTTAVVRWREGNEMASIERKSPGITTYDAITMERGITHDSAFETWANLINSFEGDSATDLVNYKKDLVLDIMNERGQIAFSYHLYGCWVSEYTAIYELDANARAMAIESIKIEMEGWERDASVVEPNESG